MKSQLDQGTTQAIELLLNAFLEAWNKKDLAAFTSLFTEDAEFTDVVNQTALGRAAIQEQHEFAFKVVMKQATLEMKDFLVREIVADIVMVTANWLVKGSQTPKGQALPDRNGVIQFVMVKDGQQNWKIKLVHNADFSLPYERQDRFIK